MQYLNQLPVGSSARIEALTAGTGMRRRLLDMGFVRGARVSCLFAGPAGNPRAYLIKNTVIALRTEDAAAILIRKEELS